MNKMIVTILSVVVASLLAGCGDKGTYEGPLGPSVSQSYMTESLSAFRSHPGLTGQSDADKFKAMGWDTSDIKTDAELHERLREFDSITLSVNMAFVSKGADKQPYDGWVDTAYEATHGAGLGLVNAFGVQLMEHGNTWNRIEWSKGNDKSHAITMAVLVQSRGLSSFGKYMSFPTDEAVQ